MKKIEKNINTSADEAATTELCANVEHIIWSNDENGFTICDVLLDDEEAPVTFTGIMPYLSAGDRITAVGKWVHNPKYGRQFKVEQYEKTIPSDAASMLSYLSSGAIKGIGPKTALKIVEEFGDDAFDVLENHPDWLTQIPGISPKRSREMSEDFKEKSSMRNAMIFFREFFGPALTVKIYNTLGQYAVEKAKANPYILCEKISGIGFERADEMAMSLGFSKTSAERIMSGIQYVLTDFARQNGHVCLPYDQLSEIASRLLEADIHSIEEYISALLDKGKLKSVSIDKKKYIYDLYAYDSEKYIASKLDLIDKLCVVTEIENIRKFIEKEELANGIVYADLQRRAIENALENGVMILTGGPGTGKTTVVRALIDIFEDMGLDVAIAAPTGRAAKRLSEATVHEASTIHRLLDTEFGSSDERQMFKRNENDMLDEDVIIVDEVSMIDNYLMCALLKAIKPGAHLILIGDSDQLPSVGAGNILRDIIDSGRFSTVKLNEIFRQASQSLIVTNAHLINIGSMPKIDVKDGDFFFLHRQNDDEISFTVTDLCKNRLPRSYGKEIVENIQVISPSRKGEEGTENLNLMLQSALNPPEKYKREYRFKDILYREGDKVMQTRNNYDMRWDKNGSGGCGIFNGDIGVIHEINISEKYMEIYFDERVVSYEFSFLDDLELAYAITVHKSQGSEYPTVIIPIGSSAPRLLTRHLLYTAVTRAQERVILVGRVDLLEYMVKNDRQSMRYTGLLERLKKAK